MTADRQSGLTQQPSSEQNGAEVEVSAEADHGLGMRCGLGNQKLEKLFSELRTI